MMRRARIALAFAAVLALGAVCPGLAQPLDDDGLWQVDLYRDGDNVLSFEETDCNIEHLYPADDDAIIVYCNTGEQQVYIDGDPVPSGDIGCIVPVDYQEAMRAMSKCSA